MKTQLFRGLTVVLVLAAGISSLSTAEAAFVSRGSSNGGSSGSSSSAGGHGDRDLPLMVYTSQGNCTALIACPPKVNAQPTNKTTTCHEMTDQRRMILRDCRYDS